MSEALRTCAGGADRFAVVDTETTGVYSTDRVVEVAIVTLSLDGQLLDQFDTLVNPCRDVSATHIHGITASMVRDAPTFDEIAGEVAVRLHGACLVAHNVPFDRRMLEQEFHRIGDPLVVTRAVDTYVGSGARLVHACAQHRIDLSGQHCASTDAWATAQLFLKLHQHCGHGEPIAAPVFRTRARRVLRRVDTTPIDLADTPLIAYLASRLSFSGLAVLVQQYLEVVGRAVSDLHLDKRERAELAAIAHQLGLSDALIAQAHRRYVNELIDAAIADAVVTDDEYDSLVRVAAALDVGQDVVEHRIASYRAQRTECTLEPGMQIVFTGDHPVYPRQRLELFAREMGLIPKSGVSRSTGVLCAVDQHSRSGKAAKARQYGIPIITVYQFLVAEMGDILPSSGAAEGLKVVMCPECYVTWTVPATSTSRTTRRCDECSVLGSRTERNTVPAVTDATATGPWAPPVVEWLSCRRCNTTWARQVSRGRKPHFCPTCTGAGTPLPPPTH